MRSRTTTYAFILLAIAASHYSSPAAQHGLVPNKANKLDKKGKLAAKDDLAFDKIPRKSGKSSDRYSETPSRLLKPDASLTSTALAAKTDEARRMLQGLPSAPPGLDPAILAALQAKALSYELSDDTVGLWEATAAPEDLADVTPRGYTVASLITRGNFMLRFPLDNSRLPAPNEPIASDAGAVVFHGNETPEQLVEKSAMVHTEEKAFVASPSGDRLNLWTPQQLAAVARNTDVFILEAVRRENVMADGQLDAFTSRVVTLASAIRAANPDCRIFVEVGPRVQSAGRTPNDWMRALARLQGLAPGSFDGFYLNTARKPAEDPEKGMGDLRQMIAWLRPPSGHADRDKS